MMRSQVHRCAGAQVHGQAKGGTAGSQLRYLQLPPGHQLSQSGRTGCPRRRGGPQHSLTRSRSLALVPFLASARLAGGTASPLAAASLCVFLVTTELEHLCECPSTLRVASPEQAWPRPFSGMHCLFTIHLWAFSFIPATSPLSEWNSISYPDALFSLPFNELDVLNSNLVDYGSSTTVCMFRGLF